jgi:condensin complex subunit 3
MPYILHCITSIRQRNTVLQRGLHDRATAVKMECLKMLRDVWLVKCCQGDPILLLKYLDVETNESVGESVMLALLNADMVKIHSEHGLKKFIPEANAEKGMQFLNLFYSVSMNHML